MTAVRPVMMDSSSPSDKAIICTEACYRGCLIVAILCLSISTTFSMEVTTALLHGGFGHYAGRLPRNLISALEARLPLTDVKPATAPGGQLCAWTSKVLGCIGRARGGAGDPRGDLASSECGRMRSARAPGARRARPRPAGRTARRRRPSTHSRRCGSSVPSVPVASTWRPHHRRQPCAARIFGHMP